MIINYCKQGSEEWHKSRLGIPTASNFGKILGASGKKSMQSIPYMAELIAERVRGEKKEIPETFAIKQGNEREPIAKSAYQFITNKTVIEVGGVFYNEDKNIMASPDGLIKGEKKGLEIKCPLLETHIKYIIENKVPPAYLMQIMGAMWVTKYDSWDFVSYNPDYEQCPMFIINVPRDDALIKKLETAVLTFIDKLLELI